jgi:hypothetical protein
MTHTPHTRIHTETGSIYEVTAGATHVRRLSAHPERSKRATDEWRPCESLHIVPLFGAQCLLITWPSSVPLLPGSPEDDTPCTRTSPIVRVENLQ